MRFSLILIHRDGIVVHKGNFLLVTVEVFYKKKCDVLCERMAGGSFLCHSLTCTGWYEVTCGDRVPLGSSDFFCLDKTGSPFCGESGAGGINRSLLEERMCLCVRFQMGWCGANRLCQPGLHVSLTLDDWQLSQDLAVAPPLEPDSSHSHFCRTPHRCSPGDFRMRAHSAWSLPLSLHGTF